MIAYPEPVDVQVVAPWPVVDRYRNAYARAHSLALGAEQARREAERLFADPHPYYAEQAEKAYRRYASLMRQLVVAQRRAWRLYGKACALGPDAVESLERARRSVEAIAAYGAAAKDARLWHESRYMLGA